MVGDASTVLLADYPGEDFVLIDCDLEDNEGVLRSAEVGRRCDGVVVVGYNAFHSGSCKHLTAKLSCCPLEMGCRLLGLVLMWQENNCSEV